jgi:hypothetical protein
MQQRHNGLEESYEGTSEGNSARERLEIGWRLIDGCYEYEYLRRVSEETLERPLEPR